MRTKPLPATGTETPWLERYAPDSSAPEVIEVGRMPFTIGRSEDCDYQIVSSRVSRAHAEITKAAGAYLLRDLGSTNGTFVNGQKLDQQIRLSDGDLVVIADVELTYRSATGSQATHKTATQVMRQTDADGGDADEENVSLDLIQAVRGLQEAILCRGVQSRYQPLVDLATGLSAGFETLHRDSVLRTMRTAERVLSQTECRLTERMNQLHRILAVEQASRLTEGKLLFLPLTAAEVGADSLADSLIRLSRLAPGRQLAAQVPESAVVDIPYFRDFLCSLREAKIGVAYDGFGGGQQQVGSQQELAPDFLKLAPALARGVDKSSQRQKQIREIVEAAANTNTQVIATGVHTENEAQTCRELGCRLGQGDHYGGPQTVCWPLDAVSAV